MKRDIKQKINETLLKLATGFNYTEITEEYAPTKEDDDPKENKLQLTKKKVSTHFVPPDMLAIKMLMENDEQKIEKLSSMTDEELLALKDKLIKEMIESENKQKTQN